MLILIRFLTAGVLAVILFVIFFIGGLAVGGGIAGAKSTQSNPGLSSYEAGRRAGEKFGREYGPMIFLGSLGAAGVISFAISFSGILPWCRKPKEQQPPVQ